MTMDASRQGFHFPRLTMRERQRNNFCSEIAGGSSHDEFSSDLVVLATNIGEGDVALESR